MNANELGAMPAAPCEVANSEQAIALGKASPTTAYRGLTKREAFAMAAMQGLAANPGGPWQANAQYGWALTNCTLGEVAEVCTQAADALLAELAKDGAK